jgi:Fungal chitosanase of glycosyl hydrolase group 75
MNGNNGYTPTDVLYIAFTGASAVPGARGADWGASTSSAFESSIESLGNSLIARIGSGTGTTGGGKPTTTSSGTSPTCTPCSWAGHCVGKFGFYYYDSDRSYS